MQLERRPFDLAAFERRTGRLEFDDIDFDEFRSHPLDPATLRCLRYMHDIEAHTVCYLRDLLVTRAHRDPEVTAFMTHWNTEEYWHGEAIGRVLAAHDVISGPARDRRGPARATPGRAAPPRVLGRVARR